MVLVIAWLTNHSPALHCSNLLQGLFTKTILILQDPEPLPSSERLIAEAGEDEVMTMAVPPPPPDVVPEDETQTEEPPPGY